MNNHTAPETPQQPAGFTASFSGPGTELLKVNIANPDDMKAFIKYFGFRFIRWYLATKKTQTQPNQSASTQP